MIRCQYGGSIGDRPIVGAGLCSYQGCWRKNNSSWQSGKVFEECRNMILKTRKNTSTVTLDKDNKITKIFIVCSGLGHVKRGYESFTQECFDALSQEPTLDITLFKGGGDSSEKEIVLWNLRRDDKFAIFLGDITEILFRRGEGYFIEQITFFLSLVPHIQTKKPDVIFFSDENLGNLLWYWRRLSKQNYKLLFSNGGPILPPFPRWDHVQQLAPIHLQNALEAGQPSEKQTLVPYGIQMSSQLQILTPNEREALRHKLKLPEKRPLIVSVGVISKNHKRMDYVIREIASLPEPRPYLLLLGQQNSDSPEIINLGNQLLGAENFQVRTVPQKEMANYYKIADAFVLASLGEGFGRVFLEAMSHGLPCLAHEHKVIRFVLGNNEYLDNFEIPGNLASLIPQALQESQDVSKRQRRHESAYNRFSWDKLGLDYVNLIHNVNT
ncbi:glycosyltransferase family 4 protein [Scytonema hofmannii]|uniref:glycosyltransferase family 4 protein n=2 Tax=Nostocales TaxID=1161 RepID=UPI0028BE8EC6|nr:glycosyltransferase family 4 protein [Scytonema hofmannii]